MSPSLKRGALGLPAARLANEGLLPTGRKETASPVPDFSSFGAVGMEPRVENAVLGELTAGLPRPAPAVPAPNKLPKLGVAEGFAPPNIEDGAGDWLEPLVPPNNEDGVPRVVLLAPPNIEVVDPDLAPPNNEVADPDLAPPNIVVDGEENRVELVEVPPLPKAGEDEPNENVAVELAGAWAESCFSPWNN